MSVKMYVVVIWTMTPCSLVSGQSGSEELRPYTFMVWDRRKNLPRKFGSQLPNYTKSWSRKPQYKKAAITMFVTCVNFHYTTIKLCYLMVYHNGICTPSLLLKQLITPSHKDATEKQQCPVPTYPHTCCDVSVLIRFVQKQGHVCPPTKLSPNFQVFTHCSNLLRDETWLGTPLLRSPWEMNRSRSCPGRNIHPLPPQYRAASALFQTNYEPKDKPLHPIS